MSNKSGVSSQIISLPKSGGALHGIGEKFSPDLHTGTGNFTVPIALPAGRNGFQPQLNLVYSSGNGNGPFGLGWSLGIPGVSRKTSQGVPRYDDNRDVFILSGAEDLVLVETRQPQANYTVTCYRPRTEGLFARIEHHKALQPDAAVNFWKVYSKDGLASEYGAAPFMPGEEEDGFATVIAKPGDRTRIFSWKLTRTSDPFGNLIEYAYCRDSGAEGSHHWEQSYLKRIRYVDYERDGERRFLVSVNFVYEDGRPDPFSEYRSGFEIRTRKRCSRIEVRTHPDRPGAAPSGGTRVRTYHLTYLDQRPELNSQPPINGVSLLSQVKVVGHDESRPRLADQTEELPPLEFGYGDFEPQSRKFFALTGALPAQSLAQPGLELASLFGNGLPDIVEIDGSVRYWRNLGNGRFDQPREMRDAPAGLQLADAGVQLIDANGDGRIDLLVNRPGLSGYFPLRLDGSWDRRSFQRYATAPSFDCKDQEVKLVDLDGDGVTDALRSGGRMECFFNDPRDGFAETRFVVRQSLAAFPDINFSDPRVKWGDMGGDGLQDIVLVHDGNVEYWPNLGRGDWGGRIHMANSPRFPFGHDPKRILIGDVDGDGLADLVYVDDKKVTLWINRSGNGWSDPVEIRGTPPVTDMDAVRLVDLLGTGVAGILWSSDANGAGGGQAFFLDFTGGVKPYLLNQMDNRMGAVTKVAYAPSTRFYLEDQPRPATRWKTPLPFPVQVVSRVEVIDELSKGKLTTEYRYHHGHWDGGEREFRGFCRVEQFDTESFDDYHAAGLHGETGFFSTVDRKFFSPPTLTKTWFHPGPVGDEFGDWEEVDFSEEFWAGDKQKLARPAETGALLKSLPRRARRDALRSLRGTILRTEFYALDGSEREDRPYTVTENLFGVREEAPPKPGELGRPHIFFPHALGQRITQWERGDDPLTQFSFSGDYDPYGQPRRQVQIACPRGWRAMDDKPGQPYLATCARTEFAEAGQAGPYIVDRVACATRYEIANDGSRKLLDLADPADGDPSLKVIGQVLNYYDGEAFVGLPSGKIGGGGALVRTESLVLTGEILKQAYPLGQGADAAGIPPCFDSTGVAAWTEEYPQAYRDNLQSLAGYVYRAGGGGQAGGYYAITDQRRYDFQEAGGKGRGLVTAGRDPLGRDSARETTIQFDAYGLLPTAVTDPIGLSTTAAYDYRVLQPAEVTDPNGNQTRFAFSPLGLLRETRICGKPALGQGDRLRPSVRMAYGFLNFRDSGQPVYVRTLRQIHHDTETEVPIPERDGIIEMVEYSDGFGRLLQTRAQAEDVIFGNPVFGGDVVPEDQADKAGTMGKVVGSRNSDASNPNVVVSGWQVYDNKGRVVEKYEPFYSAGWDFRPPSEEHDAQGRDVLGQKVAMFYDPRGRAIRTVNPDGSEQRVVYGVPASLDDPGRFTPTPWEAYTYDANDLAPLSPAPDGPSLEKRAPGHHHYTPSHIRVDALGRTVLSVVRNRAPQSAEGEMPAVEAYSTRSTYDIRGNLLTVTDQLGRPAFTHTYDLANRPLRIVSMDAGIRRIVLDAAGNEIERRDSKGALALRSYDLLNRPIALRARNAAADPVTLRESLEYGDGGNPGQTTQEREAERSLNRLGKPSRHYDEAGLLEFAAYDFKGNLLQKARRVIGDGAILAHLRDASGAGADRPARAYRVDWGSPDAESPLDDTEYRTDSAYDALNRITRVRYPLDQDQQRKELQPRYNRAGALESIVFAGDTYVERIAYDAKGQRTLIAYGNGLMTRYAYDEATFRLKRLRTERFAKPDDLTYSPNGKANGNAALQDFAYDYDLAGNITRITERVAGCGVLNNPDATRFSELAGELVAGDALVREFDYDPLYRLTRATGRESIDISNPRPWQDFQSGGFNSWTAGTANLDNAPSLTQRYWEQYAYDPAGNMLALKHSSNWTRHFGMSGCSPEQWQTKIGEFLAGGHPDFGLEGNRLTHFGTDKTVSQTHRFDANGNMCQEFTNRHFAWDHADRLAAFADQPENGKSASVAACYFYDVGGQRTKKLVRKTETSYEVTVYIDGLFEHHRIVRGDDAQQNNTLHVMDNQNRVAMVRAGEVFEDDGAPECKVKYCLGNHLSRSNIVVGGLTALANELLNREEYFPYGETSFGSFSKKGYRFSGKERDEESALFYYGARYYSPWLLTWLSCDPASMNDTINLFRYVKNNPIRFVDFTGFQTYQGSPEFPSIVLDEPQKPKTKSSPQNKIDNMDLIKTILAPITNSMNQLLALGTKPRPDDIQQEAANRGTMALDISIDSGKNINKILDWRPELKLKGLQRELIDENPKTVLDRLIKRQTAPEPVPQPNLKFPETPLFLYGVSDKNKYPSESGSSNDQISIELFTAGSITIAVTAGDEKKSDNSMFGNGMPSVPSELTQPSLLKSLVEAGAKVLLDIDPIQRIVENIPKSTKTSFEFGINVIDSRQIFILKYRP